MRIRKLASKVLGTASSHLQQSSPAVDLSATAWMMMQQQKQPSYFFCELNRSRWDVFSEASEEEQENASTIGYDEKIKGGRGEEAAMSATTSSSNITAELKPKEMEELATSTEQESQEDDWKPKKKKRTNKTNRAAAMKEESKYIESSTTVYTCKKTDGKQWRCKVPVDQPNSLCDYHLDQLLSYRCTSNTTRKAGRAARVRKTRVSSRKRPRQNRSTTSSVASTGLESTYYYSAFGPWRGKQRGVEHAAVAAAVKEQSEEEQLERYVSIRDDDDDEDEDDNGDSWEEEDNEEESSKKKKRRPVKARSLKSIL